MFLLLLLYIHPVAFHFVLNMTEYGDWGAALL